MAGWLPLFKPSDSLGGLLMGLTGPTYYQGYSPFLNWARTCEVMNVYTSIAVTISIASPGVVTWTGNGLTVGAGVFFSTSGTLPTGLTPGTLYYVKAILSPNTFTLAPYPDGPVINTTGSQSGTHTINCYGLAAWDAGLLDPATGDPEANANVTKTERVFFSPGNITFAPDMDYSLEEWYIEYDGVGTPNIDFIGGGTNFVSTNKYSFTFNAVQNDIVRLTMTVGDQTNPPRNVRIYQKRYETNYNNGEFTNPDWRAEMSKFPTLRFMDWQVTNFSKIENFSELADELYFQWSSTLNTLNQASTTALNGRTQNGPKGSIHPSIICKVLNETGCKGHVNIPSGFSDAAVIEFAEYMRDHTTNVIHYEYSNECFHDAFPVYAYAASRGAVIWPSENYGDQAKRWYGYRSAQIMKLIRDVYNDTSRWKGVVTSQAIGTYYISQVFIGMDYWISSTGSSLTKAQIAPYFETAPYFGTFVDGGLAYGRGIVNITKGSPTIVEYDSINSPTIANGQEVKFFIKSGMTQLNGVYAVATTIDATHFSVPIDSTGYSDYVSDFNWCVPSPLWRLMDQSAALSPGTYPNKYQYFNEQIKAAMITNNASAPGVVAPYPLTFFVPVWVDMKALCDPLGIQLRQYEAGNHYVPGLYVSGDGGEPQFVEYELQFGYSQEAADCYAAWFAAAFASGFKEPAKFTEGGNVSRYGTWAGIRYWPTTANGGIIDTNNPVWQAVTYYNEL